jgi:hypothetical protein
MTNENDSIEVKTEVIATYEYAPQEFFEITQSFPRDLIGQDDLVQERHLVGICNSLDKEKRKTLVKLSLCVLDWGNEDVSLLMDKSISKTNGKYYFQPDQRDEFEDFLVKQTGAGSETVPHKSSAASNIDFCNS